MSSQPVRSRDRDFFSQHQKLGTHGNGPKQGAASAPQKCAIGEKKRLKVQFIPNNPNGQPNNFNLQINPKTWPNLKVRNFQLPLKMTISFCDYNYFIKKLMIKCLLMIT